MKDKRGDRKKKGKEVGKGEWKAEDLHRANKTKSGERDCSAEALALLNHFKPLMKLWGVLMSALGTEFKYSAKGPQFTKRWAVTEEVLNSLQLLFIATYPAIVQLKSVPYPLQPTNLAVPRDKTDKMFLYCSQQAIDL